MNEHDQLFSNMLQAALDWLKNKSPEEISRHANVPFDGKAFSFESLGTAVTISYPNYRIAPYLEQWHILTLLHYLSAADGFPLTEKQITFAQQKDGMIRGGGFDHDVEMTTAQKLGVLSPRELEKRCLTLGATLQSSNADLCAKFSFAPNYPVYLKIWFADDEFPASGRMFLDAAAEHYLSIEDAVTVGGLILNKLLAETQNTNATGSDSQSSTEEL